MTKNLEKYQGPNQAGPGRSSPYPVSRLGAEITLVDVAQEIERASEKVALRTNAQLDVIAEQIRHLQEQARGILERSRLDAQLHQAECRFHKTPGKIYHVYGESLEEARLSLLSPTDHGGTPPHPFLGSFRLELDSSWTQVLAPAPPQS